MQRNSVETLDGLAQAVESGYRIVLGTGELGFYCTATYEGQSSEHTFYSTASLSEPVNRILDELLK